MLERTERIPVSFRISSVFSKVEPESGAGAEPSHRLRLRPKSTGSDLLRLRNTEHNRYFPSGLWKI